VDRPASNRASNLRSPATGWRGLINAINHVRRRTVCITEKEYCAIGVHEGLGRGSRAPITDPSHTYSCSGARVRITRSSAARILVQIKLPIDILTLMHAGRKVLGFRLQRFRRRMDGRRGYSLTEKRADKCTSTNAELHYADCAV
jgi:hypothetical protein